VTLFLGDTDQNILYTFSDDIDEKIIYVFSDDIDQKNIFAFLGGIWYVSAWRSCFYQKIPLVDISRKRVQISLDIQFSHAYADYLNE